MQKVPILPTMPWQAGDSFSHQGASTEASSFPTPTEAAAFIAAKLMITLQAVNRANNY